jgi:hypothetical protein
MIPLPANINQSLIIRSYQKGSFCNKGTCSILLFAIQIFLENVFKPITNIDVALVRGLFDKIKVILYDFNAPTHFYTELFQLTIKLLYCSSRIAVHLF